MPPGGSKAVGSGHDTGGGGSSARDTPASDSRTPLITTSGDLVNEQLLSLSKASPTPAFWSEQYVRMLEVCTFIISSLDVCLRTD